MVGNDEPHNEITLTAFRLITMDLLELFKVMNEGTINVLGKPVQGPSSPQLDSPYRALLRNVKNGRGKGFGHLQDIWHPNQSGCAILGTRTQIRDGDTIGSTQAQTCAHYLDFLLGGIPE